MAKSTDAREKMQMENCSTAAWSTPPFWEIFSEPLGIIGGHKAWLLQVMYLGLWFNTNPRQMGKSDYAIKVQ